MGKQYQEIVDREIINGKPHFGLWFGNYLICPHYDAFVEPLDKNPIHEIYVDRLNAWRIDRFKDVLHLKIQIITKPPSLASFLNQYGTVAIKFIAWGRAYKVMKLIAKNKPRYKKLRRGGKLKWVKLTR